MRVPAEPVNGLMLPFVVQLLLDEVSFVERKCPEVEVPSRFV